MEYLISMHQQKLVSSGSRETLPEEIKLQMSTENLNRQWVSWRSCKLLELSVQGCTLVYVAGCWQGVGGV